MSSNIYPCIKCGKLITRKGKLCVVCYKSQRKKDAISLGRKIRVRVRNPKKEQPKLKMHKCEKCGKQLWYSGICPECHESKKKEGSYKAHPVVVNVCEKSPTKAHHWCIDAEHKGVCLYCKQTKDFGIK